MLHVVGVQDGQLVFVKIGVLAHGLFDARAGRAHQHQRFDVGDDLRGQRFIGDLFVVAARDQNDLLVKAAQACDGARGAGRDGVVVVGDAVQHADRLDAMLNTRKGGADLAHGLDGHTAPDRRDGRQQVFNIVQAAQLDFGAGQHRGHDTVLGIAERVVALAQKRAVVGLVQAGEPELLALAIALHRAGDVVLIAQHGAAGRLLPKQDVALGVDVLLHVLVVVEVVGGHIGDDRHLGAAAHADQLEAGQLDHSHSVRRDVGQLGQQSRADVAAQKDLAACGFKHFGDQRSGGGLAVRAGHGYDLAGAELEEKLHLTGDKRTGGLGGLQLRLEILIARRAHDDILPGETVGVMLAQAQGHIQAAQRVGVIAKILDGFFLVTQRDVCAQFHKLLNAAFMADTGTDKGNFFALDKFLQLFDRQHSYLSPA